MILWTWTGSSAGMMVAPPTAISRLPPFVSSEDPGGTNYRSTIDTMQSSPLWMATVVMAGGARRIGTLWSRSPVKICSLPQVPRPDTLPSAQPLSGFCMPSRGVSFWLSCEVRRHVPGADQAEVSARVASCRFPCWRKMSHALVARARNSPSQARTFPMKTCCFQDRRACFDRSRRCLPAPALKASSGGHHGGGLNL